MKPLRADKSGKRGNNCCVVVADGARARLFSVELSDTKAERKLVERDSLANDEYRYGDPNEGISNRDAGPVHPHGAQRDRHRREIERRFAAELAHRAAEFTSGWPAGAVILIADPRMLGLLREAVRGALKPGLELKELAKDYATLTTRELEQRLIVSGALPDGPGAA